MTLEDFIAIYKEEGLSFFDIVEALEEQTFYTRAYIIKAVKQYYFL